MRTFNSNNMSRASALINEIGGNDYKTVKVKRIRKEDGLLERTEYDEEKVILVEDNRQMLFG